MGSRRPNPRLAKLHRTYTVEEAARLLSIHRNTVRAWIKAGLRTIDGRRPLLILGRDLRAFLERRRDRARSHCGPGELYCVRCRAPRAPAGAMVDYLPLSSTAGNLRGICSECGTLIHRRVARAKLGEIRGDWEITLPQAVPRIGESLSPSVNRDSSRDGQP